jgi:hypothetical protein
VREPTALPFRGLLLMLRAKELLDVYTTHTYNDWAEDSAQEEVKI